MSNSDADGVDHTKQPKVKDGRQTDNEEHEIGSSSGSSGSSSSQSESGDESRDSSESSIDSQQQRNVGVIEQVADDEEPESAESVNSNESFKSMNVSVAKSVAVDPDDVGIHNTPVKALKLAGKSSSTKSPSQAEANLAEVPGSVVATSGKNKSVASPLVVTPGKSLGPISASPQGNQIEFDQLPVEIKPKTTTKITTRTKQQQSSSLVGEVPEPELSPGELSGHENVKLKTASGSRSNDQDSSRKRGRSSIKAPKKEARSPKKKRNKKEKKSVKIDEMRSKTVEKVEEQVKALQAQLDMVCNSSSRRRKRSKKSKKHSSTKSKRTTSQSSEADSSCSSSSDEPAPSSRIGKIPMSRKLQGLAMEEAKLTGATRQGEVHAVEIVDALKIIDQTIFPTEPTQAYRNYHKIPGTGLEHIVKHLNDLQDDLGTFIKATAKLNLQLAHEHNMAKKQRVGPEAGNEFVRVWQFCNDLIRAVAPPEQQMVTPDRDQQSGAGGSRDMGKAVAESRKVLKDQGVIASGDRGKSPATEKSGATKKKKSAGTKSGMPTLP